MGVSKENMSLCKILQHNTSQELFVIKEKDCFDELFDLTLVIFITPF